MNILLRIAAMAAVMGCVACDCKKRTILTYNTALAPAVSGYGDRRFAVFDALKHQGSNADFICLQEVWFEKDMKRILDILGDDFPYHFSAIHSDVGHLRDTSDSKLTCTEQLDNVPCDFIKFTKLHGCLMWYCRYIQETQACLMDYCQNEVYDLSASCRSCINVTSNYFRDTLDKCLNVKEVFNRMNTPGLLVLSKHPLTTAEYVKFHDGHKMMVERGYIKAQEDAGLTYVCTQLTPVSPKYHEANLSQFSSYEEMQEAEIQQLDTQLSSSPHVLMGDLNTGPERNETGALPLKGEAPANYDLLTKTLNYQNPYMFTDGRCTYCSSENPILVFAEKPQYGDLAIDHVLTSTGLNVQVVSAERKFDNHGEQLSDHYGVQLDLCVP